MKVVALKQIQAANPSMYDPIAIDTAALQAVGWSNPEQFMIPANAQSAPPPEMQRAMAELQIKKQDADTRSMVAKGKMMVDAAKLQQDAVSGGPEQPSELQAADVAIKKQLADAKVMDTKVKAAGLAANMKKDQIDSMVKEQEMLAKERIQMIDLAQNLAVHPESTAVVSELLGNVIPAITGKKPL
jgi:hypothetical protein